MMQNETPPNHAGKEDVPKPVVQTTNGPPPQSQTRPVAVSDGPPGGQVAGPLMPKPPPSIPSQQTRLDNLAILSNLSSQLLAVLAKMSPPEALQLTRSQSSQNAREYHFIRSLFNPVRDLYQTGSPFLLSKVLGLDKPEQIAILRKANQAMYMSSIFTGEIGLRDMDQNFLEVFVPEQGSLSKSHGSIYLELKTQAFMTAHRTGAAQPLVVMAELFPHDVESKILARRPGLAKSMAPSEVDFLSRLTSRREILLGDVKHKNLDRLHVRYRWEDLSREVSSYLTKNFGPPGQNQPDSAGVQRQMQSEFSIHQTPLAAAQAASAAGAGQNGKRMTAYEEEYIAQAARAAEIALQQTLGAHEGIPPAKVASLEIAAPPKAEPQPQHQLPTSTPNTLPKLAIPTQKQAEVPHILQSAPTHILYEQARQATGSAMVPIDKPSYPAQRRPWTPEEEAALMLGLDRVKGPHWSQILAMHGPRGTVDEVLKERDQVQLEDKARSLKLFFLKARIEVPYYLNTVTADLETSAAGFLKNNEAGADDNDDTVEGKERGSPSISPIDDAELLEEQGKTALETEKRNTAPDAAVEAMIARAAAQASEEIMGSNTDAK
jgi:protein TBF1